MATASDLETNYSGNYRIDALLGDAPDWNYLTSPYAPNTLVFSLVPQGGAPLTVEHQAAIRQALTHASQVTGIRFVETIAPGDANINFGNMDLPSGVAAVEGTNTRMGFAADGTLTEYFARTFIWFDNVESQATFADPDPGTLGYHIILHEIGHALGLKHSFEGDITLPSAEDHTENTLMSNRLAGALKTEFEDYDRAALDWLYGRDGLGGAGFGTLGTPPAVVVNGTAAADRLLASLGDDTINGLGGNDTITGGGGTDRIDGGLGFDVLDLRAYASPLVIDSAAQSVTGAGTITFTSIERILAGNGNDRMTGTAGSQNFAAQGGADTLAGGAGNDTLSGNAGADHFVFREAGAANADVITDFARGVDKIVLDGAAFANIGASGIFAAGDGRFWSAAGATSGHDADDRVVYDTNTGQLFYDADGSGASAAQLVATLQNRAVLSASDVIVEGGGTPPPPPPPPPSGGTITGSAGNDSLVGTAGNDTIDGLAGADTMNGMAGNDTYYVTAGDVIQDSGGIDRIITSESFALPGPVENAVLMGSANINSTGNSLANQIMGNSGRNRLDGRAGNDTLDGAAGTDTLIGGTGNDTFVFSHVSPDIVTDFATGIDRIAFDNIAGFGAMGPEGNFAAADGRFWAAAGAAAGHDADDRVVYNTSTGQLYYDADGSGAGAAQLIATLTNLAALSASDISVV